MKMRTLKIAFSLIGSGLAFAVLPTRADIISFDLSNPNPAISGYAGPYATVTVDRTSTTTATITFNSDIVGGNIYLLGDGGTVAVNVNAASFTLTSISGSNLGTGFTPGPWTYPGNKSTEDGFGSFNAIVDSFDGFKHSSSTISFVLTDTSSTWASASDVLVGNSGGSTAAAHIYVTQLNSDGTWDTTPDALATGYAANGSQVPDGGATVAMLGSALVGLGLLRRKILS